MPVKDIRIIFFDIDGTLIDMEKKHITDTMLHTRSEEHTSELQSPS